MKRHIFTGLRIALGIGLLYYVLSATGGWSAAKQFISTAWLLPGFAALTVFGAAIESKRLGLLFKSQGISLSFGNGYRVVAIGTFFNLCIPGGTGGDVMKLYYLASENRGQAVEVATVLLVDRAVALFALLALVIGLALLEGQLIKDYTIIRWLIAASIASMIGLSVVALISCSTRLRASRFYRFIMVNMPLRHYLKRASDALYAFRDHKSALLVAALVSMSGHLALAGMFLAAGTVLLPGVAGLDTCVLALLGMLANALPITPGGLGVGELAFDRLFGMVGFVGGASLLLAWRVAMIPLCIFGCAFYMAGAQRRHHSSKHMDEIAVTPSPYENVAESLSKTSAMR